MVQIEDVLKKGQSKSIINRRACMKNLMRVDEAKKFIKIKKWLLCRKLQYILCVASVVLVAFYNYLGATFKPRTTTKETLVIRHIDPHIFIPYNSPIEIQFILSYQKNVQEHIQETLEEALKEDKGTGCDIPKTDPFAKEVMLFDKKYLPIVCDGKDWVKCYLSECKLDPEILSTVKDIKCTYRDIIYESDDLYSFGPETVLNSYEKYTLKQSDHVAISCLGNAPKKHFLSSSLKWEGHGTGFRPVSVKTLSISQEKNYNVLTFGFKSASKNGFIRQMPKSYAFIQNELKATVLNGYNVIGDQTSTSFLPILTGRTELENPECRKSIVNSDYLDSMPFIFYKLKEDGYRTLFFEDMPEIGTFHRFNGFLDRPTDHYIGDFYLDVSKMENKNKPYCIGDTPQHLLMMNLTDQFFRLDGNKYAFIFIANITHDDFNRISTIDEAFVNLLKTLTQRGVVKNTLVIIMGDRGSRSASETLQGKLEERLPLMAIRLPDDMLAQRPGAQKALEQNADVLTTPHDIYATVLDAIDTSMKEHWNNFTVNGTDLTRGLTLLEPVPKNRSCSEAGIEPHWCSCLRRQKVDEGDPMYKRTALALLHYINSMTEVARSKCALRTLKSIEWVIKKMPNKKLLVYLKAKDEDGYTSHFANDIVIDKELFQVKIIVAPDNAVFEATVTHNKKENQLIVNMKEISRINAFKNESECIAASYPNLKHYCFCNN